MSDTGGGKGRHVTPKQHTMMIAVDSVDGLPLPVDPEGHHPTLRESEHTGVIGVIRCPSCGSIVARVHEGNHVRFRSHVSKGRKSGHRESLILSSGFYLNDPAADIAELTDRESMGAWCSRCKLGYHALDIRDAARRLLHFDKDAIKVKATRGTL